MVVSRILICLQRVIVTQIPNNIVVIFAITTAQRSSGCRHGVQRPQRARTVRVGNRKLVGRVQLTRMNNSKTSFPSVISNSFAQGMTNFILGFLQADVGPTQGMWILPNKTGVRRTLPSYSLNDSRNHITLFCFGTGMNILRHILVDDISEFLVPN